MGGRTYSYLVDHASVATRVHRCRGGFITVGGRARFAPPRQLHWCQHRWMRLVRVCPTTVRVGLHHCSSVIAHACVFLMASPLLFLSSPSLLLPAQLSLLQDRARDGRLPRGAEPRC